jgi:CARDB
VVALLALIAVQGEPAVATHATTGQTPRAAELARRQASSPVRSEASVNAARPTEDSVQSVAPDDRPDFRLTFAALDDAQASQPISYTIQVRNDGSAAGVASVSAVVPPELTNVRVNAPGFVCTRRFAASGPQVGTLVACMRNDLESGASADVTIEANAPSAAGRYYLSAVADPRDEVGETDEANNQADVTVQVDG